MNHVKSSGLALPLAGPSLRPRTAKNALSQRSSRRSRSNKRAQSPLVTALMQYQGTPPVLPEQTCVRRGTEIALSQKFFPEPPKPYLQASKLSLNREASPETLRGKYSFLLDQCSRPSQENKNSVFSNELLKKLPIGPASRKRKRPRHSLRSDQKRLTDLSLTSRLTRRELSIKTMANTRVFDKQDILNVTNGVFKFK